jgi:hypothetical protein
MTASVTEAAERQVEFSTFSLQDRRPKGDSDTTKRGDSNTMDATLHSNEQMIRSVYDGQCLRVAKPAARGWPRSAFQTLKYEAQKRQKG